MTDNPIIKKWIEKEKLRRKLSENGQKSEMGEKKTSTLPEKPTVTPPVTPSATPPVTPHPYTKKVIEQGQRDQELRRKMAENGKVRLPQTVGLSDKVIKGGRLGKTKRMKFTIPENLAMMLKNAARASGISEGELIRCALWGFLK